MRSGRGTQGRRALTTARPEDIARVLLVRLRRRAAVLRNLPRKDRPNKRQSPEVPSLQDLGQNASSALLPNQ